MKRLYLIVGLTLCVMCVTAAKKVKTLTPTQQLQQSLLATSSLVRALSIFVPAEKESTKKYIGIASDLLLDGAFVISQTQLIINDFKNLKGIAQKINSQGKCLIQKNKNKAITCTTQFNCKTQEECAAAVLVSINELLLPIIKDILGSVEVTKDANGQAKKTIKPGLLMGLANSQAIPQSYRLEWRDILGKYTIKIVEAIEYLPKLATMIKPPAKKSNESKEVQSFREEPVVFEQEDVFSLD